MISQKTGSYAFLAGVIIAVIAGIIVSLMPGMLATELMAGITVGGIVALVLVILGLMVGYMNIKDKHVSDFLIATIAVASVGLISLNPASAIVGVDMIVGLIGSIVQYVVMLVAPAALVVGLKQIMSLAKEQVI